MNSKLSFVALAATCTQGTLLTEEIDALLTQETDALKIDLTDAQAELENGSNAIYPRTTPKHHDPKENGCLCFMIDEVEELGWFTSVGENGECRQGSAPVKTDYK